MIREAVEADLPVLSVFCHAEYIEELVYILGVNFNHRTVTEWLHSIFQNPDLGFVLVVSEDSNPDRLVGAFGGAYAPCPTDPSELLLHEFGWYVMPEFRSRGHGMNLLFAARARVKNEGRAKAMTIYNALTTPNWERLTQKYASLGGIPFQVTTFIPLT